MTDAGALEARITQLINAALKAHDAERTGTLRLIKNALKNKAIEKRDLLTSAEEQQALATMIKQRRDSIEQFTKGNRPELAAKEAAEIVVIEEFLAGVQLAGGQQRASAITFRADEHVDRYPEGIRQQYKGPGTRRGPRPAAEALGHKRLHRVVAGLRQLKTR